MAIFAVAPRRLLLHAIRKLLAELAEADAETIPSSESPLKRLARTVLCGAAEIVYEMCDEYRAKGWFYGSGAVESGCKSVNPDALKVRPPRRVLQLPRRRTAAGGLRGVSRAS